MPNASLGKRQWTARIILHGAPLCGRISLLAFVLFIFAGPFNLVPMKLGPSGWLIWDTMLSFLFFGQHSGMIRRNFRTWMAERIPGCYHGAVFTLASSLVLVLLVVFWQSSARPLLELSGPWRWAARGMFLAAAAGIGWGYGVLEGFDPFGIGPIKERLSGRPSASPPLTLRGPYLWVRHPIYFFVLVMLWSYPDLTADRLLLNLLWSVWIIAGAVLEEKDMLHAFGDGYRDYQKKVPMLIPWKGIHARGRGRRPEPGHGLQREVDDGVPRHGRTGKRPGEGRANPPED